MKKFRLLPLASSMVTGQMYFLQALVQPESLEIDQSQFESGQPIMALMKGDM